MLAQASGGEPVEWRISVAEIERDGPFSDYSGYDRTIVAEDEGFILEFEDGERVEVEPLAPFSFAGERAVLCRLRGSRASAFNVMTLRDAFTHEVRVEKGEIEVSLRDVLIEGPALAQAFTSFADWEHERRRFATWETLVKLRFAQNVHDERARSANATHARLAPSAQRRDAEHKRRFLSPKERAMLEPRLGAHVFARWKQDVFAFDPAMERHIASELALYDEYTRLTAGATYSFHGQQHSAASLSSFARNADRAIRREANALTWEFYETHAETLDRLFDDLVRCRTAMARQLGHSSYTDLAYVRLGRTDYGRREVESIRERIAKHITPMCTDIVVRQAGDLGVEAIMPWDELVFDRGTPLRSAETPSQTQAVLARIFESAHPALGAFARVLIDRDLFDLEARAGKRAGAFCSFFPALRLPHVFANFTGTSADVTSLLHEMGHAFQDYSSRGHSVLEYIVPPAETGEICSLGLEYLLWPYYGEFFGEDALRYRAAHLKTMVLMLPYIAAVDHFQELVYDNPQMQTADRYGIWQDMTARYLPHRATGGVPHLLRGGAWHRQHHIFGFPFYYVDYALALFAAFDLWRKSSSDFGSAAQRYVSMAQTGGQLPFRQFLQTHGIADPFEEWTIEAITSALAHSQELTTA